MFKKSILEVGLLLKPKSCFLSKTLNFKEHFSSDEILRMFSYIDLDSSRDKAVDVGSALKDAGFSRKIWERACENLKVYKILDFGDEWDELPPPYGLTLNQCLEKACDNGYKPPDEVQDQFKQVEFKKTLDKGFPLIHWSELNVMKPRNYLVKGLIDCGAMSVLYGASNSGKTFIGIDLACHIALGWEWCGKKVKQGAVVYIAAEGGLGIQERLTAFKLHHSLEKEGDIFILPKSVNLGSEDDEVTSLMNYLERIPNIALIVVDTLARTIGEGEENASSDMNAYIKNCDFIREITGAHVMVIHHTGKDENRGARGHSALKAAIDTEIEVLQKNQIVSATITKQREGRTGDKQHFEFKEYEVRRDEDNDPVYSCALQSVHIDKELIPLSGQAHSAWQVLQNLMIDDAIDRVPKKGMASQRCVRLAKFKEHFVKSGIADTDKPDSLNRAFLRAKNGLKNKGYIGEWDGYIWLLDKSDNV